MSLFGRGGDSAKSPAALNHDRIEMAMIELDTVTDFFNRMVRSCHAKCIGRLSDPDLTKGESVCIDRCVAKFVEVQKKVGEKLQNKGNQAPSAPGSFGAL